MEWRCNIMGNRNHNVSKDGIKDVYIDLIEQFAKEGRDSTPLKKRLGELNLKDKKKDRLITAEELLRNVIKDAEDFRIYTECPLIYIIP